jgi:anti-anti-sigma factor
MSLSLDCRYCGNVYVVKCIGRVVIGEPCSVLEAAMKRGLLDTNRVVINAAEVNRVDSTGIGLLVRFVSHTRNRGGDLRLASPQPFLHQLLETTKITSIMRVVDSEEAAIVSFLKEPVVKNAEAKTAGPLVLFLDESPDLCAFVRTLLNGHGYEVLTTCRLYDAQLLLKAAAVDYLVLGPDSSQLPNDRVVTSLKPLAPNATTVVLDSGFKSGDAECAGFELLQRMRADGTKLRNPALTEAAEA